jgi:hypothetical protein
MSDARGLRSNNPLNIDYHASMKWQGMADPPSDGRFVRFTSLAYGLRAGFLNARAYKHKHGIHTLGAYMQRFAPIGPENPRTYHDFVSKTTGIPLEQAIDLDDRATIQPILRAQVAFENGITLEEVDARMPKEVWDAAWSLARPISQSRTIRGSAAAVVSAAAGAVLEATTTALPQAIDAANLVTPIWPEIARWVLMVVALAGAAVAFYSRWEARKEGIR